MDEGKLDIFNPAFIMGFIVALISDISFLFLLALAIPVVGIVVAIFILTGHYIAGIIVGFLVFQKTNGSLAKLALGLAIILPLPLLTIGILLAILLSNSFVRFAAEQAAIAAIGAATGGAGAVAAKSAVATEGAAVAAEGVAAGTTLAGEAGAATAEIGAEAMGNAGGIAGTEAGKQAAPKISGEALGEEKSIFEKLKEPMENFSQPHAAQEDGNENRDVELDDETGSVNLKKAA